MCCLLKQSSYDKAFFCCHYFFSQYFRLKVAFILSIDKLHKTHETFYFRIWQALLKRNILYRNKTGRGLRHGLTKAIKYLQKIFYRSVTENLTLDAEYIHIWSYMCIWLGLFSFTFGINNCCLIICQCSRFQGCVNFCGFKINFYFDQFYI